MVHIVQQSELYNHLLCQASIFIVGSSFLHIFFLFPNDCSALKFFLLYITEATSIWAQLVNQQLFEGAHVKYAQFTQNFE